MVSLIVTPDGKGLWIRLSFNLDVTILEHATLIERRLGTRERIVDFEYWVDLRLHDEWEVFSDKLRDMWAQPIGQLLRATQLRRLRDSDQKVLLAPFAAHGWHLFRSLFVGVQSEHHSKADMPYIQAAVESLFARPSRIEVKSPNPLFPWALLYQQPFSPALGGDLAVSNFWGFKHELQQMPRGVAGKHLLPASPRIVAAICPDLDADIHHTCEDHPLSTPMVTVTGNASALAQALRQFDGDCLYFYGHARQTQPPSKASSQVELARVPLSVSDLQQASAPHFDRPLVLAFLNGCDTAPIKDWSDDSLAGYLCLKGDGRLCCIVTVAQIPAAFGARFAYHFWKAFMKPSPVGQALQAARNAMLDEVNSPLGLLYTYFGLVDVTLNSPGQEAP